MLFSSRGFVFGLWSACASVGNILGAFLASSVLKYGYEVKHRHPYTLLLLFFLPYSQPLNAYMKHCMLLCAVCLPGDLSGAVCWWGGGVLRPAYLPEGSW